MGVSVSLTEVRHLSDLAAQADTLLVDSASWQRSALPHSCRTCRGDVTRGCFPDLPGVITNPLLAALPCHLNQLWVWAPDKWRTWVCAHGNTAHGPINARAVVFAVGLKCLPVLIPDSIEDTSYTNNLWKERKKKRKNTQSTIKILLATNSSDVFLYQADPCAGSAEERRVQPDAVPSVVTPARKLFPF